MTPTPNPGLRWILYPAQERMIESTNNRRKRKGWPTFSLRRFLVLTCLLCVLIGLVTIQQQRQRKFFEIVSFVERSFETSIAIPSEIANHSTVRNIPVDGNHWVSSVAHSPSNGPAFISSEHELIYRPSVDGKRIADITVVTSWHILRSQPQIHISTGGRALNEMPLEYLRHNLLNQFGITPITTPNAR